ncbi:MAG: hypothetical protein EXQ79_00435 [Acidimicrobiia bacterium]|nr:hypothetical protein [Acidimicrobiia bacterium]
MAVDISKLSRGEQVVGASGIVLLIFSFFNWYGVGGGSVDVGGVDVEVGGFGVNGWQAPSSFLSLIAILLGIAMAGYVVAKLLGVELPAKVGGQGIGLLMFGGGVIALLFVLIKYISNTEGPEKFGFYVSILACVGLAAGGYLIAKERGDLPSALGGKGGGSSPMPPAA